MGLTSYLGFLGIVAVVGVFFPLGVGLTIFYFINWVVVFNFVFDAWIIGGTTILLGAVAFCVMVVLYVFGVTRSWYIKCEQCKGV